MFWDPYAAEVVAREQRRALLREAERDRLVRQALAQDGKHPRLGRRALAGLGRCMASWGQLLQEEYGAATEATHRTKTR